MAEFIKALAGAGKAPLGLVATLLMALGALLIIGGFVYRVFVRPEWTFEEALHTLWPYFVAGCISLTLGWVVDRVEG
jgi:hypothetical protein